MNATGPSTEDDQHSGLSCWPCHATSRSSVLSFQALALEEPTPVTACPGLVNNTPEKATPVKQGAKLRPPGITPRAPTTATGFPPLLLNHLQEVHCQIYFVFISARFCELAFVFRKQMVFMLISSLKLFRQCINQYLLCSKVQRMIFMQNTLESLGLFPISRPVLINTYQKNFWQRSLFSSLFTRYLSDCLNKVFH